MVERLLSKAGMVREKVIGILCLTVIALASMMMIKMNEPENVIINVVVAIAGFIAGGTSARREDKTNEKA